MRNDRRTVNTIWLTGALGASLACAAACSTPMHIMTGNPSARVLVDGQQRGRGEEVTISERVGMSRRYHLEARVSSTCRDSITVDARQNEGRVFACMLGSVFSGAASSAIGTALATEGDSDAVGVAALAGVSLGGLLGLICLTGGYEAPEFVDLDTSHCRPEPKP